MSSGREYSFAEIFAIKFVLADVIIIAALLLAPAIYAVAITALLVLSTVLLWYFTGRDEDSTTETETETAADADENAVDPVTELQQQYAAGDISEDEFESRLDRLIESNERAEEAGVETRDLELERSS
ncbi:SHOCT domain-containing protein [Halopiger goleimassiliensis]|uniref:SHOCT domain-containing protein n=1 Tax=Halopiger goleimassiliensis TaxID=1293048 RepID=UPI000677A5CA|nr:SHOCT domain-containing protein [Halopiger goleimassiliensis]